MNIKVKNFKTGEEKQLNHKIWVKKLIKKGRIRPEEREILWKPIWIGGKT